MHKSITLSIVVFSLFSGLFAQDCATCPEPTGMFRSIDGSGNNVQNCDWGKTHIPFQRATTVSYGDGISSPRGVGRRSPREISNIVFSQNKSRPSEMNLSSLVFTFLQVIDHDITLTPVGSESLPISVPSGDLFDPPGYISFHRSDPFAGTGTSIANPRQQYNEITAFLDGSFIYGSDCAKANWIRANDGTGKLKTSPGPNGQAMLPWNTTTGLRTDPIDPSLGFGSSLAFVSGDLRANEQPGLTALHTLFLREHNRLCDEINAARPELTGDQVYQRARKKLGATFQAIVFEEVLPALGMPLDRYEGYRPDVRPDLSNVFSTTAYRLGHTMVSSEIWLINGACSIDSVVTLRDGFFNPSILAGRGLDPFLKGLAAQPQEEIDAGVVDELRNFLFGPPGAGGLDLVSLNIQRAREHGIPDFNQVRMDFGLDAFTTFAQITSDTALQAALALAYNNDINEIDPWVGMLAEDHLPGVAFGQTIYTILKKQFSALRDGDRYYYEHDPAFTEAERAAFKATRLADVIQRNTGISGLQPGVLFARTCYCLAQDIDTVDACRAHISRVTMGSIDHVSGHSTATQGYSDYTSFSSDATPGATLSLALELSECRAGLSDTAQVVVWVDADQSGLFAPHERVFVNESVAVNLTQTLNFSFDIPESAKIGQTRFRVRVVGKNESLDPCADFAVGEVEDYSLNIIPCQAVATPSLSGPSTSYFNTSGVAYSVTNNPGSTYEWSVTGGNIASGQGSSSIAVNWFNQGGIVSVVERVNGCPSEIAERQVTLIPNTGTVVLNFTDICKEKDQQLSVPVTVENFIGVKNFSFEVAWDPAVMTFLGTSGKNPVLSGLTTQLVGGNLRATWAGIGGFNLANGTVLFYIDLKATGSIGSESPIGVTEANIPALFVRPSGSPLAYHVAHNPGQLSVCMKHMIAGALVDTDGFPIADSVMLMVEAINLQTDSCQPDPSGNFAFDHMQSQMGYFLRPRAMALPDGGIDIFDMIYLQRHLLAVEPFSTPYIYISADLDAGGWVDIFDMIYLQRFILALDNTFPGGDAWRFVATDSTMSLTPPPSPASPLHVSEYRWYDSIPGIILGQDFVGVRMGDITKARSSALLRNGSRELYLDLPDAQVQPGSEVILPVTAAEVEQLAGYQFSLGWDPTVLALKEILPGDVPGVGEDKFNTQRLAEGLLSTLWVAPDGQGHDLPEGTVLFFLRFQVTGAPGAVSSLELRAAPTRIAASDADRQEIPVAFHEGRIEVMREALASDQNRLEVFPNPFQDQTTLRFSLAEPQEITLQVFNAVGQLLLSYEGKFEAGVHDVPFSANGLSAGVYYGRLRIGQELFMKELVLLK